jgi:hypothetical protein
MLRGRAVGLPQCGQSSRRGLGQGGQPGAPGLLIRDLRPLAELSILIYNYTNLLRGSLESGNP